MSLRMSQMHRGNGRAGYINAVSPHRPRAAQRSCGSYKVLRVVQSPRVLQNPPGLAAPPGSCSVPRLPQRLPCLVRSSWLGASFKLKLNESRSQLDRSQHSHSRSSQRAQCRPTAVSTPCSVGQLQRHRNFIKNARQRRKLPLSLRMSNTCARRLRRPHTNSIKSSRDDWKPPVSRRMSPTRRGEGRVGFVKSVP